MTRPLRTLKNEKRAQNKCTKKALRPATHTNWHTPLLWVQIAEAAKHPHVRRTMNAREIKAILVQKNPTVFSHIPVTTIYTWIDYKKTPPQWKENDIQMAEKGIKQGGTGGKLGVFVCARLCMILQLITPHHRNNILRSRSQ